MEARVFLILAVFISVCAGRYEEYERWLKHAAVNQTIRADFDKHLTLFKQDEKWPNNIFPCEKFPPSKNIPTSVHRLRPGDIQVVSAMGDSITAGTGITASTIIGLLWQDRGLSWSIGGDGNYEFQPTIPNILRKYNPNVKGFSVKSGSASSKNAHLDVAVPGAKSEDMAEQAQSLIDRMGQEPDVDMKTDWKLITVFIGGNDLCDYCEDTQKYNASNYVERVQQALDILYNGLTRALVSVVLMNHVDEVQKLNVGIVCSIAHRFLCECGAYPRDANAAARLHQAADDYSSGLTKLISSGRYDQREDFTVVIQPFFSNTKVPLKDGKPDVSYLAPDCFHFSRKGHAAAAIALWNNMIHPTANKRTSWLPGQTPDCSDEDNPYLATPKNIRG